jgi:hypothetical protein
MPICTFNFYRDTQEHELTSLSAAALCAAVRYRFAEN